MHEYSKAHAASSSSSGKPSQSSSEACGLHAPHGGMSEGMSERWFNAMSDTYVGRVCWKACREGMPESGFRDPRPPPQRYNQGNIKSGTRPYIYIYMIYVYRYTYILKAILKAILYCLLDCLLPGSNTISNAEGYPIGNTIGPSDSKRNE